MGYSVKLTTTVNLNGALEGDIVEILEELKKKHKVGEYVSNCIRVVSENPELAVRCGMDMLNSDPAKSRKEYFSNVYKEISKMEQRVDRIYKMCLGVYVTAKLALGEQAKNIMAAQFILQKQIDDLKKELGVQSLNSVYASNKIKETDKLADDILEYIIQYHSELIKDSKEEKPEENKAGNDIGLINVLQEIRDSIKDLAENGIVSTVNTDSTQENIANTVTIGTPITTEEQINEDIVPQTSEEFEDGADWEALAGFLD